MEHISATELLLALLGAIGIGLIYHVIFRPVKLPASKLIQDLQDLEIGPEAQRRRRLTVFAEQSALDRLLSPLLWQLATALDGILKSRDRYQQLIVQARFPRYKTVADVYVLKVIYMVGLTIITALIVWLLRKPMWAPVIPLMLVVGFMLPDLELRRAVTARRQAIVREMGFVLDRLLVYRASGETLPMAIVLVAQRPGGAFIQELRALGAEWQRTANFGAAIAQMCARNQVSELDRLAATCNFVVEQGAQAGPALEALADAMQQQIAIDRERQARQNETLMIFPALVLVIPMLMGVILLPALSIIAQLF
ncbi:MAG: type II secretion system F family protein [Chloroflexi bacterium]|nr:type II secretion system F family protein [Chloroflexota bacterium]MBU1748784.1 type II secretion system F family protein [Chloroflexota bacterium]